MANENKTFLLFTYGTLMRHEQNHYLLDGAKFLTVAKTKPQYRLLSIEGNYPFPALMEGGTSEVMGEIYEVPVEARDMMDRIEGHPNNYCRKPCAIGNVQITKGNQDIMTEDVMNNVFNNTIAYVLVNERWTKNASPINSGNWRQR